jgi:hypothetical protein
MSPHKGAFSFQFRQGTVFPFIFTILKIKDATQKCKTISGLLPIFAFSN